MKLVLIILLSFSIVSCSGQTSKENSNFNQDINMGNMEVATLGAGCFWCVEAVFTELNGVVSVTSGYMGGKVKNPTYKEVCSGLTGHAEVAQIVFDPNVISFKEILEVFWKTHDPTTLNRQGNDIGTQYRSAIFYHDETQKEIAEFYKSELNNSGAWDNPIVTEISPLAQFYPAEDYHQNYFELHGEEQYCKYVIQPKVEKFKKAFVERVNKLKIGNPLNDDTNMGAVVSKEHMEKVLSYINLAKEEGGTILTGGKREVLEGENANGYFLQPTVIEGLSYNCRTNQEEIFGPVVTLTPFKTEEEVLMMANSVKYGLASTVWSQDISKANRVAAQLEAGITWINCWLVRDLRTPFGGVKNSGVGREGGFHALNFFTEPQNVCIGV
jgi:methionine-S-sulfoxide reductase